MTYSVYQHWDPLKVCIVGRSWPPEFYSWITVPHVRSLFERIAIETEQDYQAIIAKLREFGVEVLRPDLPSQVARQDGKRRPPPMYPRDRTVMIGKDLFVNDREHWLDFYKKIKDPSWPQNAEFADLPAWMQQECVEIHGWKPHVPGLDTLLSGSYQTLLNNIHPAHIKHIRPDTIGLINGADVSRVGRDLYFGTRSYLSPEHISITQKQISNIFPDYRCHVVNTGGHSDSTYCPVCPGLIISLHDVPTYAHTFPGWEVVYLPGQSWSKIRPFLDLKKKNRGKWWIPGFEYDQDVITVVEQWLSHWTGYVEETVFDVNMLIVDPKNVIVFNYNKQVFDTLSRYGITAHVIPFRHRYFWDGGIHCVTSDLHREGTMQDYFPHRQ